MRYISALVFITICSLFLSLTAQASDSKDALNLGFQKLYLQELERYTSCREASTDSCWFGEVESYLDLMD